MKRKILIVLALLAIFSADSQAQDLEQHFLQAQEFYQNGRFDDAVTEFAKVVELLIKDKNYDGAREITGNIGVIRIQQERFDDAISAFEEALALPGKTSPDTLLKFTENITFCADQTGDHAAKADAVERLLAAKTKLDPLVRANFLAAQGDAYRALGLYGPAVAAYQQAAGAKNYPAEARPTLLTAMGLAQGNLGNYAEAFKNLEIAHNEAVAANNALAIVESLSNQGILHWEQGRLPQAIEFLEEAQARSREFNLRRNEGVDHNNIGAVFKTAGQWQKAIARFDLAYDIAKEVGNRQDEAIALSNRALLEKLTGFADAARRDYQRALDLYMEVKFMEGVAGALTGLAAMDVDKSDFVSALARLTTAREIYEDQGLVFRLPMVYVQLGLLYQGAARTERRSRDLVFEEDEPPAQIEIERPEALKLADEFYAKAETISETYSLRQFLWKAVQGRAGVAKEMGDLVKAEALYAKAIEIVLSIKGFEENSELLLYYLVDKEDLFTDAIEVCNLLYKQTNDQALLEKQMRYDEIYRNEVIKANMQMSNIEYQDPAKRDLFDSMKALDAQFKQASKASQQASLAAQAPKPSRAAVKAAELAQVEAKKLEGEYEKHLAQWKTNYPEDSVMFETISNVDLASLKSKLLDNQAIIQYIPLENELIIILVTRDGLTLTSVGVKYNQIVKLVTKDFLVDYILGFKSEDKQVLEKLDQFAIEILTELTSYLYDPIKDSLNGKDRLFIITSKYISYIPFYALILENNQSLTRPKYLVDEKTISFTRLSFIDRIFQEKPEINRQLLSVGNPEHAILKGVLGNLENAEKESIEVINLASSANINAENIITQDATKENLMKKLDNNKFGIMHFATHGMPYSDAVTSKIEMQRAIELNKDKPKQKKSHSLKFIVKYFDQIFPNNSHFNSFLYLSADEDYITRNTEKMQEIIAMTDEAKFQESFNKFFENINEDSGLLTIKEILSLSENYFSEAYFAILSACNTAVSFVPKAFRAEDQIEDEETGDTSNNQDTNSQGDNYKIELIELNKKTAYELGWSPGVDEICFVDVFMRKNFQYVYGTLWFADDDASGQIVSSMMKNVLSIDPKDPPEALRASILEYLENPPKNLESWLPLSPYYWAIGNIFGN